jgi:ferredoxin|tara:strand:- start:184 stop:471 length:288 start_codon:yes stop_codon:yes gene_type:complete
MAKIIFDSDGINFETPDGSEVCFIVDKAKASLPFDCFEGVCATCCVLIISGKENLNQVNDQEKYTLGDEKLAEGYRLGCQIRIKSGTVILRNGWE